MRDTYWFEPRGKKLEDLGLSVSDITLLKASILSKREVRVSFKDILLYEETNDKHIKDLDFCDNPKYVDVLSMLVRKVFIVNKYNGEVLKTVFPDFFLSDIDKDLLRRYTIFIALQN